MNQHRLNISEGLQRGDLENCVSDTLTIDRYSSKMGEDKDVVVVSFTVREKNPAVDLMEFIEKGYQFILDADMSTGEEHNGKYQVFAEIQRSEKIAEQILSLLNGVGQLCGSDDWKFQYQKSTQLKDASLETILEEVPKTPDEYEIKINEFKESDLKDFFDQGGVDVVLEENNIIKFSRPFSESIKAKFIAIGKYDDVKRLVPGKLSLDESSQSQCVFLNKYLGTYDIDKIGNKFLISHGDNAVIIEKERW